jgi:hypothetical protein
MRYFYTVSTKTIVHDFCGTGTLLVSEVTRLLRDKSRAKASGVLTVHMLANHNSPQRRQLANVAFSAC